MALSCAHDGCVEAANTAVEDGRCDFHSADRRKNTARATQEFIKLATRGEAKVSGWVLFEAINTTFSQFSVTNCTFHDEVTSDLWITAAVHGCAFFGNVSVRRIQHSAVT